MHAIVGDVQHLKPGMDAAVFVPTALVTAQLVRHFVQTRHLTWLRRLTRMAAELQTKAFLVGLCLMWKHMDQLLARRREGSMPDEEHKLWCLLIDASAMDGTLDSVLKAGDRTKWTKDACEFYGEGFSLERMWSVEDSEE